MNLRDNTSKQSQQKWWKICSFLQKRQ